MGRNSTAFPFYLCMGQSKRLLFADDTYGIGILSVEVFLFEIRERFDKVCFLVFRGII